MKTLFALLSLAASAAASAVELHVGDVRMDSELGRGLLSHARRLNEGDDDFSADWIAGYSLKFQGCHHISQWNNDIADEADVRIATKRLVRFRLCPSDQCSATSSSGCGEGYGDYIVDMNTYLEYYFSARQTYQQFQCGYLVNYACGCDGDDDCLYNCLKQHNMETICAQNGNNNINNGDDAVIQMEDYMTCTKSNYKDASGNSLYIGPFCASQGGAIQLGAFTDDACTNFADSKAMGANAFAEAAGYALPYAGANLVDLDCLSCKEPNERNNDGNDAQDADDVAEVCESLYTLAGKCETNLEGTVANANTKACTYLEGIKMVRKDGTVITADSKANKTAAVFIAFFTTAFVLLSAYVYYLKLRLERASINLED